MIEQSRLVDLKRSKVRIDLILNYKGNSKAKVTVLEFKSKFFVWPNPDTVGVWGSPLWQPRFEEVEKVMDAAHVLESEFSFFLKSSENLRSQSMETNACGEVSVGSKRSNRFGVWAFDNVHLDAWVVNDREVFLLKMHHEDENGRSLQGPKANEIYRVGASEQRELWLALREISDEVASILNSFSEKQFYPPCNATDPVGLPDSFGPNSSVFAKEVQSDSKEAEIREEMRNLEIIKDHLHLAPEAIRLLENVSKARVGALLNDGEEIKEGMVSAHSETNVSKPKKSTRVKEARLRKNTEINEALSKVPLPWPVKPSEQ